jgi:hypothetical protein
MMKRKTFRLVLVVSMLVAFLTIGVGISVLEADDDYCGWMRLETVLDGAFTDHPEFPPQIGELRNLKIYLQRAGSSLFRVTGKIHDVATDELRAIPFGTGNLWYDDVAESYKFTMSLTGTEVREATAPATLFNIAGIAELTLDLDAKEGDWWRLSYFSFGIPNDGIFVHLYSWGTASLKKGKYDECFDFKDK